MRITFFVNSIVGYVDNPSALYTRAFANSLATLGNNIRVVEERQNEMLTRTLRTTGSRASRHVYERFPLLQHSTYDPRTGAPLLEWLSREVSLIDIAIAVQGVNTELTRWIANISREGLTRAFLVWEPEALDESDIVALELEKFDIILAPTPIARLPSLAVQPSLAEQDLIDDIDLALAGPLSDNLADAAVAAATFERDFAARIS